MFQRVLVANRGEIACRVLRTLRQMGCEGVAIYTPADGDARHRHQADVALPLAADNGYLDGEAVLAAARQSGAEAIHPGYGFLAENADFAEACRAEGLVFIGPDAGVIRAMGVKDAAKRLMQEAGVPVVPGYHGAAQDDATLLAAAGEVGYPLLVKAAAGGGGRGMRLVAESSELPQAIAAARREALAAFGDDRLLLERYLGGARHIEVQVFGDSHGNRVHLFERECSLQRRHQKVIEEAPSPFVDEPLRERLTAAALRAADAVDYTNAGTVEFVVDDKGEFYFLEMNTRLQVEHPVTEMITGIDLVAWQVRVAAGEPLPLTQAQIGRRGHAIEARICAEDPARDYLPVAGAIGALYWPPQAGADDAAPRLRIDSGVGQGSVVGAAYDSLLAKMIAWGPDRQAARAALARGLWQTELQGLMSNLDLLQRLLDDERFAAGEMTTQTLDEAGEELLAPLSATPPLLAAVAVTCHQLQQREASAAAARRGDPGSPWQAADGWWPGGHRLTPLTVHDGSGEQALAFACPVPGSITLQLGDQVDTGSWRWSQDDAMSERATLALSLADQQLRLHTWWHADAQGLHLTLAALGGRYRCSLPPVASDAADEAVDRVLRAPMAGKVIAVNIGAGEQVVAGQPLVVIEAMKMEHVLTAGAEATVATVFVAPGDQVTGEQQLLELLPLEEATEQ